MTSRTSKASGYAPSKLEQESINNNDRCQNSYPCRKDLLTAERWLKGSLIKKYKVDVGRKFQNYKIEKK
jgi:hypothetical protein